MSNINMLRNWLENELEHQTGSARDRLAWLATQVEEYVRRWAGFAALSHTTLPSLVNSDFFLLIHVATEMMTSEMQVLTLSVACSANWSRFVSELGRVETWTGKQDTAPLVSTIAQFRKCLEGGTDTM